MRFRNSGRLLVRLLIKRSNHSHMYLRIAILYPLLSSHTYEFVAHSIHLCIPISIISTMARAVASSGLGSIQMWGLSPARNLAGFLPAETFESGHLNILLFGEADLRHSLKTLSSYWRECQAKAIQIHFYVVENSLDLYARQMIMWALALEPLEEKGIHEKVTQFVDIFGNLLIRPQTKKYLLTTVEKLIRLVTDDPELKAEYPIFDFSQLKYRERDQIVEIFKFWLKNSELSLKQLWDVRIRQHLGTRYDSRFGVFDWDYNMNLIERGANTGIISIQEYKTWRNTGVAFAEFETEHSQPNLTLTTGAATPAHNYWGEILTGPFIAHGIECDDSEYFAKTDRKYKKKSVDVTQHNLDKMLTIISSKSAEERRDSLNDYKFTIHFVSPSNLSRMIQNAKYRNHFQLSYFANSMVQYLKTSNLTQIMHPDCAVVVEDATFVMELKGEQIKVFDEKVLEIAQNAGLKLLKEEIGKGDNAEPSADDEFKYFKIFKKRTI